MQNRLTRPQNNSKRRFLINVFIQEFAFNGLFEEFPHFRTIPAVYRSLQDYRSSHGASIISRSEHSSFVTKRDWNRLEDGSMSSYVPADPGEYSFIEGYDRDGDAEDISGIHPFEELSLYVPW